MKFRTRLLTVSIPLAASLVAGCHSPEPPAAPAAPAPPPSAPAPAAAAPEAHHVDLPRLRVNQLAMRLNLPLYWAADKNKNGSIDPDEVRALLFYPTEGHWVEDGKFTPAFEQAFAAIVKESKAAAPTGTKEEVARRKAVREELDHVAPTLVHTDLGDLAAPDHKMVEHLLTATRYIDMLYSIQTGERALKSKVPADEPASQSLMRRNWGPRCKAPSTEKNPACSAIPGAPRPAVDVYPAEMQEKDDKFCKTLEKNPHAKKLLTPFTVVRQEGKKLTAVPYSKAYKKWMGKVAGELTAAADAIKGTDEAPMETYLRAAAQSFKDNNWEPADEAWSKMTVENSHWYLRVGPDEVYWEPCSHKAGFHLTFAKINKASLKWQKKLTPLQQDMEDSVAKLTGAAYKARKVTFHLPDFIDIVVNSGDDRAPFGATIGQSLPNWGKVVADGRGRTVAMSNLYNDPDSLAMRRAQASSLVDATTIKSLADDPTPSLLSTILHEATHNLGPAHEYKFRGKTAAQAFGGGMASMLEELKAQSGALYFIDYVQKKGIISPELARQTYLDSIVWCFGHISRGMYTPSGQRKAYSQLAAIQIGFLMDEGAIRWDDKVKAANGKDTGAFVVDFAKLPAATTKLMKLVATIKAKNDKKGAEALAKKYVDGKVVPQKAIADRFLRFPKTSFVYSLDL